MATRKRKWALAFGATALALAVVGCSGTATSPNAAPATAAPASVAPATAAPASAATLDESTHKKIAFFGFAKANSFAQASFAGIEEYAKAHNADATFFDGAFDAAKQVQQIQDATTAGTYQVFIIQANDGAAVIPAVKAAIAKGITVVAEFTPIGTRYDTAESQVDGMIFVGDVPTSNGAALATLALKACADLKPCTVAYLQGFKSLPLDNARTKAVVDALKAGGATVIDQYEGGYTQDSGRKVGQDLFLAHPDVNVVVGSSQAIEGLETVIPAALKGKVQLVGNGASEQAVNAVKEGRWFGVYYLPEKSVDATKAAELGLAASRGATVPMSTDIAKLVNVLGTKDTLQNAIGEYKD